MDLKQEIEQKRDRIGCMAVGCSNNTKLHFHHVQKELKRCSPLNCGSVRGVVDELRKCVVLCSKCHKTAHNQNIVLLVHKHMEFCHLFLSTSFYVNTDPKGRHTWMVRWKRERKERMRERWIAYKAGVKTKWCRDCKRHLDVTHWFYKRSHNRDGLQNICKNCHRSRCDKRAKKKSRSNRAKKS